ncbi:hypothetical protein I552_0870 [Mycobacterium xenopi 3993]|nr:hypothetical protein I552_0870 [Mycobacterium xenopi 3993]
MIWECDKTVYRAGWLRAGIVCPAQLGTAGYLYETPQRRLLTDYWELIVNDKLVEAMDYGRDSGLDQFDVDLGSWFTCYPGGPITSPTGAVPSSTRRRCWVYRWEPIPTRGLLKPNCLWRLRNRSRMPTVAWGLSRSRRRGCGMLYR